MTYNFDPDNWYESEIAYLRNKLKSGMISEEDFQKEIEDLDNQHEEMWKRLDGSYQIPQLKQKIKKA